MIVAEVLCQHLLYGGSVIVSVDYDKLEGYSHNIDDIVRDGYGGDMYMYIFDLVETINRLENALISVLAREETADVYDA